MTLTNGQLARYSRHLLLSEIGPQGQEKLLASHVLIVGLGGLGSPAAMYLAAAGVGTIGLVDGDIVELSNLQRQIVHATPDLGRPKVASAADRCRAINPDVALRVYPEPLRAANTLNVLRDYDFVIDATDNFAAKFLLADACHLLGKPYSHAGVLRFEGQTITVRPGQTTCYRCLFEAPPPPGSVLTTDQVGVLGALAGLIGTLQAIEAIKFLVGIGQLLTDRLLVFDALRMSCREVSCRRNEACPLCGRNPRITALENETDSPELAPRTTGDR